MADQCWVTESHMGTSGLVQNPPSLRYSHTKYIYYKSQVSDSGQINVKMTHHTLYLTHHTLGYTDTLAFGASTWFRSDKATAATVTFSTVFWVRQRGTTVPVSINGYALGRWRRCSKWPLTILAWHWSQQHAPVPQASCFQVGLAPCQSPAHKEMMSGFFFPPQLTCPKQTYAC